MKRLFFYLLLLLMVAPLAGVGDGFAQTAKKTAPAKKKPQPYRRPSAKKKAAPSHRKTYYLGEGQKAELLVKPMVKRVVRKKNGRRIVTYTRVDQTPISHTFNGIDISHYQHYIRWSLVAENDIQFVYIKATEGEEYRDEYYETNVYRARRQGLKIGSYLFFRPSVSAKRQFDNFRAIVREENQDLLPLVDVEETDGMPHRMVVSRLKELLDLMTDYYGQKPMIYTMTSFYNTYLQNEFMDYPFMLGGYTRKPVLLDGKDYVVWQFSAQGKVQGVNGCCDLDVFNEGHTIDEILFDLSKVQGVKIDRSKRPMNIIPEEPGSDKALPKIQKSAPLQKSPVSASKKRNSRTQQGKANTSASKPSPSASKTSSSASKQSPSVTKANSSASKPNTSSSKPVVPVKPALNPAVIYEDKSSEVTLPNAVPEQVAEPAPVEPAKESQPEVRMETEEISEEE